MRKRFHAGHRKKSDRFIIRIDYTQSDTLGLWQKCAAIKIVRKIIIQSQVDKATCFLVLIFSGDPLAWCQGGRTEASPLAGPFLFSIVRPRRPKRSSLAKDRLKNSKAGVSNLGQGGAPWFSDAAELQASCPQREIGSTLPYQSKQNESFQPGPILEGEESELRSAQIRLWRSFELSLNRLQQHSWETQISLP